MRTPQEISADASALVDTCAASYVPVPTDRLIGHMVEFMAAVSEAMTQATAPAVAASKSKG